MAPAVRSLILGGIVLAMFAVVLWVLIPIGIWVPRSVPVAANSPAFWPRVIAIGMLVLGALEFGRGLIGVRRGGGRQLAAAPESDPLRYPSRMAAARVAAAMLLMLAYYYAVQWLGMLAASVLAIVVFAGFYGERRAWLLVPVAVALPLALYYFFVNLAHVPLPQGVFG